MTRKVLRELPALFVLLLSWTVGMAQESLYTYGGSGQDSLDSIAVSGDGRIAVLLQQSDTMRAEESHAGLLMMDLGS